MTVRNPRLVLSSCASSVDRNTEKPSPFDGTISPECIGFVYNHIRKSKEHKDSKQRTKQATTNSLLPELICSRLLL
ncbi:hypothetical protein J6590_063722 [Homalodisca vitripennis]|nr:hypothetical protein J6590_063722 [Homalodisca vitripennis]